MESALKGCDLIMKGGVTSGVVYPHAITALAESYRFYSIGGTSAGAIAAAVGAAAEYRRQKAGEDRGEAMAGFARIHSLPDELSGEKLFRLFQPTPSLARLFRIVVKTYSSRSNLPVVVKLVLSALKEDPAVTVTAGAGLLIAAGVAAGRGSVTLFLLLGLVVAIVALGVLTFRLYRDVMVRLVKADFGLCPGIKTGVGLMRKMPGENSEMVPEGRTVDPALGEWLHETIEEVAGPERKTILTMGDLAKVHGSSPEGRREGVVLAAMTTDLSSQRPYQLPLRAGIHWFNEHEFRRVLPAPVVDYLVEGAERKVARIGDKSWTLISLKSGDDFPVFLVARMSLSFPGLIAAIPLFREDAEGQMRRCLFTDGGVSSNFPVHFFDSTLPRRPTFGISLATVASQDAGDDPQSRVSLPSPPTYLEWVREPLYPDRDLPVRHLYNLGRFAFALLDCAKDWQDTLQSRLPGFAERIVRVHLRESEGGLNLNMDKDIVRRLASYGREAGLRLKGFDFDAHRNLRTLVAGKMLRESGQSVQRAFTEGPVNSPMDDLLRRPLADAPDDFNAWRRDKLSGFAVSIMEAAKSLPDVPHHLPHVDASLRLVARPDLTLRE